MTIRSYRDLTVWQRAMELMVESYRLAAQLPKHETYGLAGQIRRAAVSVPANIAEGNGRLHRGDYVHHLSIARGSIMELDTLFEAAVRLSYLRAAEIEHANELVGHVGRMLTRLMRNLRSTA